MTIVPTFDGPSCGCDSRAHANGLLGIDDALRVISHRARPVDGVETVPLSAALGRGLAAPVFARANVPPFDNAAMDGFALNTRQLVGSGPWVLTVADRIAAGARAAELAHGTAARIFTGAPVPQGADAVVMQEEVNRAGDRITLARRPDPGQNIRRAGEDLIRGAAVIAPGRRIGPRDIAGCAAAGQATVDVRRAVRVALLVTGDEVRTAGQGLAAAQIWDINTPALSAILSTPDTDLVAAEHGADRPQDLRAQLARLASIADLVVTTGGISVGEEDHVKPTLAALGGTIHFSGVAIKPGKPVSFGALGGAFWLGLPGNPLSAMVTWHIFGTALLQRLAGITTTRSRRRHVVLDQDITRKPGRCELRPARIIGFDGQGREVARCAAATHSARVATLPEADGLLFLPADAEALPQGALVEFDPFKSC